MTERRWGEPWMNEPGGVSDKRWEWFMRQMQAETPSYRLESGYGLLPGGGFNPSLAHAEYMASAMRPMVWPWGEDKKTATMTDEQAFEELGMVMVAKFPWKRVPMRVEGEWECAEDGLWWRK